ncbi:HAMP domain-containing sensor histidine kinase [Paenibacillus agricola]|uniref:Signal transduction histidine-protein kinase ArlS n=1 Tax=Paenibacillus agricola TaxID=2716264 RepID=A0ABX0J7M3_9BACL|nr:HAMP domain-containing histidine kinase [Paenibacillus agricola]NHN29760.1 HAMP domain-containing histidine kinase [Paenibacillus agricola]
MNTITRLSRRLPIKWRLTLLSSLLLFLLFAAYSIVQYVFVEQWMLKQEESHIRQNMAEILNYFLETEITFNEHDFSQIRPFLDKSNHPNQFIRVLNEQGFPIATVSDDIPEQWVDKKHVSTTEITKVWYDNNHLLIMRSPLTIFQFNGTIEIAKNMEDFEKLTTAFFRVMVACGLLAVFISGLGGRLLARQLLIPLQSMADTIRLIKQQGLHKRVQFNDQQDEISTLMKMFNEMMDQVEKSFLQQKQFVEDASHELRTPLAIVEGHISMLKRWGKNDPAILEESLHASIQELDRLKGLVHELLALTRVENVMLQDHNEVEDLQQSILLIIKNVALLHPLFRFEQDLRGIGQVKIVLSAQHLEQILLILLDNAVKYSLENKTIQIRGMLHENNVMIEITDYGMGIPETDLPFVLNRFYRVDKARSGEYRGHGLGLSIAKRLVEQYNGRIKLQSIEHQGTTVMVSFPLLPKD